VCGLKTFIENDWQDVLKSQFEQDYYHKLHDFLKVEYETQTIYPNMYQIYQAFQWTSYEDTKVVILGQDPYHEPGQAIGCSFAVAPGTKLPPSLVNIYKELQSDEGCTPVQHGYLKSWADQGVLLLNSVLTVRRGQAYSHRGKGWEQLTDYAIKALSDKGGVVFILWGSAAKSKSALIDTSKNTIISSVHPSPLSAYRGFFGSKPFSQTNKALLRYNERVINWQLPTVVDEMEE
jgi:uracil-DNA glycosylase